MNEIAIVGLDLAKHVFQIHGADTSGRTVLKRKLRRREMVAFFADLKPCVVAMEACATAHFWARQIAKAGGHAVKLIPPQYVRPYVRRNKNDAADAAAICEAASRPEMRFCAIKTAEQQTALTLHRTRALLVKQRTMLANAIRCHLAEYGYIEPQGINNLAERVTDLAAGAIPEDAPEALRPALRALAAQFLSLSREIVAIEQEIAQWHASQEESRRLASIPGIATVTATALTASVGDVSHFKSAREFAAWIGLTPRQNSSGGKEKLGRISKRGDPYLRRLLVNGASVIIRHANGTGKIARSALGAWVRDLLARKPRMLVAVALANKLARIAWAVLTKKTAYRSADGNAMQASG
jgi:transposase